MKARKLLFELVEPALPNSRLARLEGSQYVWARRNSSSLRLDDGLAAQGLFGALGMGCLGTCEAERVEHLLVTL